MIIFPNSNKYLPNKYFIIAKFVVLIYFILWFWFLLYLYQNWADLVTWKKVVFGGIELILTPNIGDAKIIFQSYSQFKKDKEE
jgi:hypothetical protein